MSVNENLLNYGDEGEIAVINYFKQFGLEPKKREAHRDDAKSIYENMKFGDVYFQYENKIFNFDVKRGCFISDISLSGYRGKFYILIPNGNLSDIGKARVVKRSTVQSYYSNVPKKDRHTGPSGSEGYRFTKLKNFILLEDFVPEFIKRLIILNDQYDYEKQISPMGELSIMFNKVLPEHVNQEYINRFGRYYK